MMSGNWRKSTWSNPYGCVEAASWRKSSHSPSGTCVEAATWRKSTYSSMASSDGCVGAGTGEGIIGVRDTTLGSVSPVLVFSPAAWGAFTGTLK